MTTQLTEAQRALLARRLAAARRPGAPAAGTRDPGPAPAGERIHRHGPEAGPAPLSLAQRRMWFLEKLEPGTAMFNVPEVVRLRGPLDAAALGRAWRAVVARHDALRTTVDAGSAGNDGAAPVQTVHPPGPFDLPVLDLTAHPAADREARAREIARADVAAPLDVGTGPPWRMRLIRLADDDHVLVLVVHHGVTDDRSARVLFEDLALAYAGRELAAPAVTYADVARWQHARLSAREEERLVDHWRAALDGAPPVLELPLDRPRPARQRPAGREVAATLPATVSDGLVRLAAAQRATPFMALLAGFAALLARYAGDDDVPVGVPLAGRDLPELDRVVGCLLNTLVLRVRPDRDRTFRDLLTHVREITLDGFEHAALPFERLVDRLRPARDLAVSPLYQVMFNVIEGDGGHPLRLPGVEASYVDGVGGTETKADLSLTASRDGGRTHLHLTYRTDLFDPASAADLLDRYAHLLASAVAEPDRPLAALSLGEAAVAVATPRPDGRTPTAVHERIAAVARGNPDAIALCHGDATMTYGALDAAANRLAHALLRAGVRPGDRVAIAVDRSTEMVVATLAVLKAAATYVPLDPNHPRARRAAILERAAPVLLLVAGATTDDFAGPVLDVTGPRDADCPETDPGLRVDATDAAYVVFTSGSTGVPKGVLAHHGGVANYLEHLVGEYGLGPSDTVLQIAGLAFDASVRDLFGSLCAGARVVLLRPEDTKEPAVMLDLVRRHRVTCLLSVVPTLLRAMTAVGGRAAGVRLLLCSGERLHGRDVTDARALFGPRVVVVNQYGPTECTMTTTFHRVEEGAAPDGALPAGRPIPGARVHVLDPQRRPVPPGVPGEVHIGGAGVAAGYLDDPEQSARRFLADPFDPTPGARLYRTGDRGRLRVDGTLIFLGRTDDQVKIRGIRVEPGEVEAALRAVPGIREAAVAVHVDAASDQPRLVGYHVGGEPDPIRAHLRAHLPEHLVPTALVALERLPRTANGKVDRKALPAPPHRPATTREYTAPRTDTERRVAAAFAEVLGAARVGASDHFFDLGGDSFAAVTVTRLVGAGMRVVDLFRAPTVAQLAALLDGTASGEGTLLVPLRNPAAPTRTLVCVPYAGGSPISFRPLAVALPPTWAVHGVAMPGHDLGRPDEVPLSLEEVAEAVAAEIRATVRGPVSLYGHCSGSAFAVEIARRLEESGHPVEVVYAAAAFPNTRLPVGRLRRLSLDRWSGDRTYHTFFRAMGGFGDQLSAAEVRQIIKNLRHDSTSAEDYYTRTYADPARRRLTAPIVSIVGDRDPLTEYHTERYREWLAYTGDVRLVTLERAGHYFLKHRADAVGAVLAEPPSREPAAVAPPVTRRQGVGVFAAVAATQFVSLLGSGLTAFALGVWMFQRTGSVSVLGMMSVCAMLPGILVSPVAGAVVDRLDRRTVMLVADLGAGLGTLTLAGLLWSGQLRMSLLYLVLSWTSVCGAFQRPAYVSAIPQLIPKRFLARANGLAMSADAGSQILAPLLGGALVTVIGLPGVITVDVVTFLVSVATLLALRFPNSLPWRRRESFATEIAGGWRFILRRPGVLALLGQAAVCNVLLSVMVVLVTPLVLRSGSGASALGLVLAGGGIGALAGGLAMALWGGPRRLVVGILNFALAGGVFIALMGMSAAPGAMAVGMFGFWCTLAVSNGCYTVLIQIKVPHHLHGRVFALNQMVAFSTMPLGFLLAGPLADRVFEPLMARDGVLAGSVGALLGVGPGRGVALLMVVLGVLTVGVNLGGYALPRLRRLEEEVPDADPDAAIASA
jgi:amino acid adenylation domain-containing protein